MEKQEPQYYVSDSTLTRWTQLGLITAEQEPIIRAHLHTEPQAKPSRSFNIATISMYFGGFMILFAYSIFIGIQWEDLSALSQTIISFGTIALLIGSGAVLRAIKSPIAGNLLIFAGTGIVPLLIYCIQNLLGLWPADSYDYVDFYHRIAPLWITIEVVSIISAAVIWRLTRFPLHALLISFWTWFLTMDALRWLTKAESWDWGDGEQIISTLCGIAILLFGVFLQKRGEDKSSFWFYLVGHMIVLCHLSILTLDNQSQLSLVFIATYIGFVVASVWLNRTVFLVFGAIGIYGYVCYLAFDIFDNSLGFTFALASVGFFIVLTAVAYQKFVGPWLNRFFSNTPNNRLMS